MPRASVRTIISYITGQLAIAAPFICRGALRHKRALRAARTDAARHNAESDCSHMLRCTGDSVPAGPHPSRRYQDSDAAARVLRERDPAPAVSRGERRRRQQPGRTARGAAAHSTFRRHGLRAILCRRPRRNWWRLARLEGRARGRAALVGGVRRAGAGGLRLHPLPPADRRLRATLRRVRRRRRVPRLSWVRS